MIQLLNSGGGISIPKYPEIVFIECPVGYCLIELEMISIKPISKPITNKFTPSNLCSTKTPSSSECEYMR